MSEVTRKDDDPERISPRWALIVALSAAIGVIASTAGLAAGLLAAGGAAVALHTLIGP